MSPVAEIVARVPAAALMSLYSIPAFDGANAFLRHVAAARGRLRRGGTPDINAAAKVVLQVGLVALRSGARIEVSVTVCTSSCW